MIFYSSPLGFIKVISVYSLKSTVKEMREKVSHRVGENAPRLHAWSNTQNIQYVCEAGILTASERTNRQA